MGSGARMQSCHRGRFTIPPKGWWHAWVCRSHSAVAPRQTQRRSGIREVSGLPQAAAGSASFGDCLKAAQPLSIVWGNLRMLGCPGTNKSVLLTSG